MLPLMGPAIATSAIFTFIWTWSDFFTPLIYLTDPIAYTVPVALRSFLDSTSGSNWGAMFAMSIVSLVPLFLAFLFGQRFLVKGIATTGGK
jgi:multiple sugar transport system permease protein